jgi:hypothetical protein
MTIQRALATRFDEVCQSEVRRLGKKTASLSAAERACVEDLTAQVLQAMADRMIRALEGNRDTELAGVVETLFRLTAPDLNASGTPEARRSKPQSGFDLRGAPIPVPAR